MKATQIFARASSHIDATGAIVPVVARSWSQRDSLDRVAPIKSRVVALTCGPYVVQSGPLRNAEITVIAQWHVGSAYYSEGTNQVYRLVVTVPTRVF